jgi:ABC-2 type transport system ATP-binding protein
VNPILDVRDVSFCYNPGVPAVERVSFAVPAGAVVGLIGPNGSGKSTLIKNVADLVELQTGRIQVGTHDHDSVAARSEVVYLASNDYLPEFLSAWEYLVMLRRLYGCALDREAAEVLFERYSMAGRIDDLIEDYSHGMRKKTQLVAAFLLRRPLTIIDETLNGIDLEALHLCEQELRRMRDEGCAVLLCTHDFALLERLADHVLFLDLGELVASGPTTELVREHGSLSALVFDRLDQGRV